MQVSQSLEPLSSWCAINRIISLSPMLNRREHLDLHVQRLCPLRKHIYYTESYFSSGLRIYNRLHIHRELLILFCKKERNSRIVSSFTPPWLNGISSIDEAMFHFVEGCKALLRILLHMFLSHKLKSPNSSIGNVRQLHLRFMHLRTNFS